MERAPLRPVPARPAGPVDPAAAVRAVAAALPALEPLESRALALVALADRSRPQVADLLGIDERELGALLTAARKELRQTLTPLQGSGWCERAEGLISDRLDGALGEWEARRLDVHLRNCPRCVEHERRLVQATDALLAGVVPLSARAAAASVPTALMPVGELEASGSAPGAAAPGAPSPDAPASAVPRIAIVAIALILTLAAVAAILAIVLGVQL
jgi:putative zinc finger protein